MSFSTLVLFLLTITGGCQGKVDKLIPSNYTFRNTYRHDTNVTNCNVNEPKNGFTMCHHPSILTDSVIGGQEFSDEYYYSWSRLAHLQVLFTFPSEINLTEVTLYYYSYLSAHGSRDGVPDYGLPRLFFFTVEDDFVLEARSSTIAGSGRPLILDTGSLEEGETVGVNKTKQFSTVSCATTRKLVMERGPNSTNFNFALSEIEFSGNIVMTPTTDTTTCITTTDTSITPSQTSKTSPATSSTVVSTKAKDDTKTPTSIPQSESTVTAKTDTQSSTSSTMQIPSTTDISPTTTQSENVSTYFSHFTQTIIPTPTTTGNPQNIKKSQLHTHMSLYIAIPTVFVLLILFGLAVILIVIFVLLKYRKSIKDREHQEKANSGESVYDLPNEAAYDTIPEPETIKITGNEAYGPLPSSHGPGHAGNQDSAVYELVMPVSETAAAISMEENAAYTSISTH